MFQAYVAVNVKTGGMFLRITQNGESVKALVALWCADKRLFARARLTRTVVLLQSCDRSHCCDLVTSHAWLTKQPMLESGGTADEGSKPPPSRPPGQPRTGGNCIGRRDREEVANGRQKDT